MTGETIFEEHFGGCLPAKRLARSGVQAPSDVVKLALGVHAQVLPLGQVLTDQSVGVRCHGLWGSAKQIFSPVLSVEGQK